MVARPLLRIFVCVGAALLWAHPIGASTPTELASIVERSDTRDQLSQRQRRVKGALLRIDVEQVYVNRPFWIFVEGTGGAVRLPEMIEVDGVRIQTGNQQHGTELTIGRGQTRTTERVGFSAVAFSAGTFELGPFEVEIDGKIVLTNALSLVVKAQEVRTQTPRGTVDADGRTRVTKDDFVFIESDVSKKRIFEGEPILLSMRLWRIVDGRVQVSSYRGAKTVLPTTEGFYETELTSVTERRTTSKIPYEVHERRKLLYATSPGTLTISPWHWEGIARVRTGRSLLSRPEDYYYSFDTDPIDVEVRPLPPQPPGFSGAVGSFEMVSTFEGGELLQGVPVKFSVTVRGSGNPDALGDPAIPKLDWAFFSEPIREVFTDVGTDKRELAVRKIFEYTLTPLESGEFSLPSIGFTYFDTEVEKYRTSSIGPYAINVRPSAETQARLVVHEDLQLDAEGVAILGEDIRPLFTSTKPLRSARTNMALFPLIAFAPIVAYFGLAMYMGRRRRFQFNPAYARAYHAKSKALGHLQLVAQTEQDPAEELTKALVTFVSDCFNRQDTGMTSAEVEGLLREKGIDAQLREQAVKIIRACERARFASQSLSTDELHALIAGAESCVVTLDADVKKGKRR